MLSPEYILFKLYADVAELADAMDLKFIDRNIVRVQVPLSAPFVQLDLEDLLFNEQDIKTVFKCTRKM